MEMSGTCFEIVSRWLPKHSLQQSGRRLFQAAWFRNRRVWWAREEWKGWACMRNVGAGVGCVCVWGGGAEEHTSQLLSEKWAVTVMAGWEDGVVAPMSENSLLSFSNPSLQLVLLNGRTQCYPLPVEMPSSCHLQV